MTFTVAIVGRPNVGKSTLFNRLAGKKLAIVHDRPGVTRDRREAEAELGDLKFTIIDTAGFETGAEETLEGRMRAQTQAAISTADVSLFVIDARAELTSLDQDFAQMLRRGGRPVIVIANKCEGRQGIPGAAEANALGLGEPIPVSAEHGEGLDLLYHALAEHAGVGEEPAAESEHEDVLGEGEGEDLNRPLRIAVVGRPNAGKSSLINKLIGEERFVTGPEAGITRDSVSVEWQWGKRAVKLFDTAGLRRKTRVSDAVEKLSVGDTLRAIKFAEVVLLVVDVSQPFEKQDLAIADLVVREGRALVIVVNKWDTVADRDAARRDLQNSVDQVLPQIKGVRLVFLSALTGEGMKKLLPSIEETYERWNARVPTAAFNRWLEEALARHPPPIAKTGRRIKLRYGTQAKTRPPSFILFTTSPADTPDDYLRYLVNSLRETFDFAGVPIRLNLRKGKNPYAD